jgi:hypothetical protein
MAGRSAETPTISATAGVKGRALPRTPDRFNIGTLLTKDLVTQATPTSPPRREHPRGAMLRAYDQKPGRKWGVLMPAGCRVAHDLHGQRQAVHHRGGERGNYSGEYNLPRFNG